MMYCHPERGEESRNHAAWQIIHYTLYIRHLLMVSLQDASTVFQLVLQLIAIDNALRVVLHRRLVLHSYAPRGVHKPGQLLVPRLAL